MLGWRSARNYLKKLGIRQTISGLMIFADWLNALVGLRPDITDHRIRSNFNPDFPDYDGATMNFQDRNGKAKPSQIRQLLDAIDRLKD